MASPDRDNNILFLLLLLLIADRDSSDLSEFKPLFEDVFHQLERDFDRQDSSPFPVRFLFNQLRRSLFTDGSLRRSARIRFKIEQIYSHIEERFDKLEGELKYKLSNINKDIEKNINNNIEKLHSRLRNVEYENIRTREEASKSVDKVSDALKNLEWALSVGVSTAEVRAERSIPVRIYLSDNAASEITSPIIDSIVSVLESLAFQKDMELPEESGSWWKRIWMKSKELATQEEIQERLIKIERIAETKLLDKPQAEANKDHATAVATIMKSLENVGSACVQIGNILLVKHTPRKSINNKIAKSSSVMVRTLNAVEMRALEKNQSLLKDPVHIIQKLECMCAAAPEPSSQTQLPPTAP